MHASLCRLVSAVLLLCVNAFSARAEDAHFADPSVEVSEVVSLMSQRLALMPQVAAWKFTNDKPVTDPAREAQVLATTMQQAQALGIDPATARELFQLQIELASRLQVQAIAGWRQSHTRPEHIRSLDQELRPALDRLGNALLLRIYLALPEIERADFIAHYGPLQDRLNIDGLTQSDRERLVVALGQIRRSGVPTLSQIRASGKLRIGTTGDYAPFSAESAGVVRGADIELARSLARALGLEPYFVRTRWTTLLEDYRAGKFDIAMSGISVTADRAREAAFSVPYQQGGKTAIVRCGTQARFDTLAEIDRPQVRVVVNPGGTNETFTREHFPHARITVYPDNKTIFDELVHARADVMVTDDVEVELQTRRHPELCRATSETFTHAHKAILMNKEEALKQSINEWLKARIQSGEVQRELEAAMSLSP